MDTEFDPTAYADVVPVPDDDSPDQPAPIAYSPQFSAVMDVFRALYASREASPRALVLCSQAIRMNAANYTAWHYRRFVIEALIRDALGGSDDSTSNSRHLPAKLHEAAALVSRELAYVDGVAAQSPKNYQLWQHRRWLTGLTLRTQAALLTRLTAAAGDGSEGAGRRTACCRGRATLARVALAHELQFTARVLLPEDAAAVAFAEPPPVPCAALLAAPDGLPPAQPDDVSAWDAAVPANVWGRTLTAAAAAGVIVPVELAGSSSGGGDSDTAGGGDYDAWGGRDTDAKNYHAWAHRQWALAALAPTASAEPAKADACEACACFEELPLTPPVVATTPSTPPQPLLPQPWSPSLQQHEVAFTGRLLCEDVRNNSAWAHRHFVLARGAGATTVTATGPHPALASEVTAALALLGARPAHNDSAWAYTRALLAAWGAAAAKASPAAAATHPFPPPDVVRALLALRADAEPGVNVGANECLVALLQSGHAGVTTATATTIRDATGDASVPSPASLLAECGDVDVVRAAYWTWAAASAASSAAEGAPTTAAAK